MTTTANFDPQELAKFGELVPDELLQRLAAQPGEPFARLLRRIDDFDHDGALAALAQIAARLDKPLD